MRILLIISIFLLSEGIYGQTKFNQYDDIPGVNKLYKPAFQADYPAWGKMIYAQKINYTQIKDAFEQRDAALDENFKPLVRYVKIWLRAVSPYADGEGFIDLSKGPSYYENLKKSQSQATQIERGGQIGDAWSFLGPKETFWLNESGMVQTPAACPWQVNIYSLDVSQSNPNIIFCGTETGFVNASWDKGETWTLLAQDYHFGGGITAVAIDPSNEHTIYVSGGNQIHKSMDSGLTWMPMLPQNNLFYANRLSIHEEDTDKILATSSNGVHISLDGGESWSNPWTQSTYDAHFKPDNPDVIYAVSDFNGEFRIAVSEDGGMSFSIDSNFPGEIMNSAGALLAVTPANPDIVLAILLSPDNTPLIYRGVKSQDSWTLLATGQSDFFPLNNGQGYFDLVLEISPIDENIVFAGTSTLYRSTNGGSFYTIIGGYGGQFPIHPDIQDMKLLDNGDTWVATDGGLTYSSDNFSSTDNAISRNNGMIGSDFWGFDQGWNEDIVVGGRYHNGNTAIADFYQPKALRMGGAESPTGWILKGKSRHVAFNDLGAGWILPKEAEGNPEGRFLFSKYPNMDEYGGRRGNLVFHPNYYETIFLGEGNGFWKSEDMGQTYDLLHDFGSRIRYLQIAYNNPNILYADIVGQGLFRSEDGGLTWTLKPSLTNGENGTNYWKGRLHFDISPTNEDVIYACLQNGTWTADIGKVFRSNDGGETWEDWTSGLSVLTKNIVIQPDQDGNDIVYLFTSTSQGAAGQAYVRKSNENEWSLFGEDYPSGFDPNYALPFYRDSKIRIAGNGGVWENNLLETNFSPIIQPWVGRPNYNCKLDTIQFDDHSILNHENADWNWEISPEPLYIENSEIRNPKVVLGQAGTYDVKLTVNQNGISYTKTIVGMVSTTECPSLDNCENPDQLPKEIWGLSFVDSEEVNDPGLATMAFDGDPATIWHTRWSTGSDPYPHEIQVDLGDLYHLYEFTYLPRQVGQNGRINEYELYVSESLSEWGEMVSSGNFENSAAPQQIEFAEPLIGRYFRLVAKNEVNGNAWASAAEFSFKGCYYTQVGNKERFGQVLQAYPIPTHDLFKVQIPSKGKLKYRIYDMKGNRVSAGEMEGLSSDLRFDLSNYESGIYQLVIIDQDNVRYNVKIVKN